MDLLTTMVIEAGLDEEVLDHIPSSISAHAGYLAPASDDWIFTLRYIHFSKYKSYVGLLWHGWMV